MFWLGAATLVAGVVAPVAFTSLPSPALAGSLVGRVLPPLFIIGVTLGILVAAAAMSDPSATLRRARVAAALFWAGSCGVAQFSIIPAIARVRDSFRGPVDSLDIVDPRRLAFTRLHSASVGLLGLGMVAAATVAVLAIMTARARLSHLHGT
jgi:hypothetical protein